MPGQFNPSGPIESPKDTESKDGLQTPVGQTLPAGAVGKGDKDPNRK